MTCRKPLYSADGIPVSSSIPKNNPEHAVPCLLSVTVEDEKNASSDEIDEYIESEDKAASSSETNSDTEKDSFQLQTGNTSPTAKHRLPSTPQRQAAKKQAIQPLPKPLTDKHLNLNLKLIACAIIICACAIILPLIARAQWQETQWKHCAFEKLRQQKPFQTPDVWNALTINIELLLNKKTKSPNVYLLLHSNQSNQTHIQGLVQDIALETSKCFDGQRPIEMSLQDFETKHGDDYGHPIEQYKKKLKEGNVFLIVNLNDIPPNSARALHTICDTYSPIAPDVIIFLTLRTHHKSAGATPPNLAYKTLRELWHEVPENELDALITRVIDQVLLLQG